MQKIHMEIVNERTIRNGQMCSVPRHYFYLCDGANRTYLCKQRVYRGVSTYFRYDIPVKALNSHKWGRDKSVDRLMELLPRRIASAQQWDDAYAA